VTVSPGKIGISSRQDSKSCHLHRDECHMVILASLLSEDR
jgi:hypothetical protein